jgi:hypothetical protein
MLWLIRVDVTLSGAKWTYCNPYDPREVYASKSGYALAGLVEKYYTFSTTPTYIVPDDYPYITGTHNCNHYSETLTSQITYSN